MPLVTIRVGKGYNPFDGNNQEVLTAVIRELPKLLSEALSLPGVQGGTFPPEQVVVFVEDGARSSMNISDLNIVVQALHHEDRLRDLDHRRGMIADGVKKILTRHRSKLSGLVWIFLSNGSVGTF